MSFSLHGFIMAGLRDAVGQLPDYKVIMNATGWYEKSVLTEADLAELQVLIDAKNSPEANGFVVGEREPEEPIEGGE